MNEKPTRKDRLIRLLEERALARAGEPTAAGIAPTPKTDLPSRRVGRAGQRR